MLNNTQFNNVLTSLEALHTPGVSREQFERALYIVGSVIDIGEQMLNIRSSGDLGIEIKSDMSPVTRADKAAQEHFQRSLPSIVDYPILSEESNNQASLRDARNLWIVDELDGTSSFKGGYDNFGPCVALYENGEITIGVTGFPAKGRVFFAVKNGGAYLFHKSTSTVEAIHSRESIGEIFEFHGYFNTPNQEINDIKSLVVNDGERFRFTARGASEKFTDLASGQCDAAGGLQKHLNIWDIAANEIIIRESGGTVFDLDSQEKLLVDPSRTKPYRVIASSGTPQIFSRLTSLKI